MALLEVRGLTVVFAGEAGPVVAVDRVSFTVERGRTLGIVGESGSGKSVTALSIMGLLAPPGRIEEGSVRLGGEELLGRSEASWLRVRGQRIAMIFQEPSSSLNPIMTVGAQLLEASRRGVYDAWRRGVWAGLWMSVRRVVGFAPDPARDHRRSAALLLEQVRIPAPEAALRRYPYTLSGGMIQRVMIAVAMASRPELLIADEPTTALDVTIQAQVLDILRERRDETGLTMLLITHDLGLVAELCDDVVVMYAGQIMERAPVGVLFDEPAHPYTRGLLASMPSLEQPVERLAAIEGSVPRIAGLPREACHFAWNDRCPLQTSVCRTERPPATALRPGHEVACHVYSHAGMAGLLPRLQREVWPPPPVMEPAA